MGAHPHCGSRTFPISPEHQHGTLGPLEEWTNGRDLRALLSSNALPLCEFSTYGRFGDLTVEIRSSRSECFSKAKDLPSCRGRLPLELSERTEALWSNESHCDVGATMSLLGWSITRRGNGDRGG